MKEKSNLTQTIVANGKDVTILDTQRSKSFMDWIRFDPCHFESVAKHLNWKNYHIYDFLGIAVLLVKTILESFNYEKKFRIC